MIFACPKHHLVDSNNPDMAESCKFAFNFLICTSSVVALLTITRLLGKICLD